MPPPAQFEARNYGVWKMKRELLSGIALAGLAPGVAFAQANANPVTEAEDAFGYRTGDEAVGIYDESSVRGFSLEAAGNYRVHGTYFVKNSGVSSFFLENTTVRIGTNTLGSVLPGPSGVVDYRLRDPGADEPSVINLGLDEYLKPYAELHLKGRDRRNRYSYSLGLGRVFQVRDLQGGNYGDTILIAGSGRIGSGRAIARVFAGEYQYERPGQFRVSPGAEQLPSEIERGRFLGQDWARERGQRRIAGALFDLGETDDIGGGATLVFSQDDPTRAFLQLFSDLLPDGTAHAKVVATPQQRSTAWSGQLRAHAGGQTGKVAHRIHLTLRGRVQRASIGGAQVVDLGRTAFGERPLSVVAPELDDHEAALRDSVDQYGVGLTYLAVAGTNLRVNLGVLRSDYRKRIRAADGIVRESSSSPWLFNAAAGWRILDKVELYGSYARGIEEAGVAPLAASNRNEVLEAILVTQRELGLRWSPSSKFNLVAAAFHTDKPYAGINAASGEYGFLGQVRHRGIEVSASARPLPGLTIVAGGVLIDPKLSGPSVDNRIVGNRPVGVPKVRSLLSADFKIPGTKGMSVDASLSHVGSRAARSALAADGGQLLVKPMTTLNLGLRRSFGIAGRDLVARLQVLNAFNQYSWDVNNSETLNYTPPRRFRLVLTTPI
ncbi:TonB-dependent receptor domain-containing protein [Altererythrobacter sp. Z27]|uniref:TonB-dependent receptor domain-containing protein n=1 Tax=Altererythrobacter sp. Z27 TaxID=3461147 RepID=UPI004044DEF4